ncbi:hypothetical protein N0B31_01430 [Salinirubellus salinus]|uniref:Uncharacterized protein n=1 Tax=Salinirubellus salinus TaxID=1364945 RepID=A0A9E7R3M4_9EURY|nr:hypothetical protein [Salinirubellus salinus]UWM54952.1 hypothetical protein N0B31_01430 [Salinirubellus salinus]
MLSPPVEAWALWVGLTLVSVAMVGVAAEPPRAAPADAAALARTVDGVAASDHAAVAEHPLRAAEIRVRRGRLALRRGDRTARATLRYGPVVPAFDGPLARVRRGTPPDRVFDSAAAFRAAVSAARERSAWRPAPERLTARAVSWGGVDVTLVG